MDNNRSKRWYITDGDYISNDLDYGLEIKSVEKREKVLSVIYIAGFVVGSLVLMLIILQLASKI